MVLEADLYDQEFYAGGEEVIQTVDYGYDAFNQLVWRSLDDDGPYNSNPHVDTFYSWEAGQIVFQFDGGASAVPAHRYLFNPVAVDQLFVDEDASGEVLWALTDHLGTVRDLAQYDDVAEGKRLTNYIHDLSAGRAWAVGIKPRAARCRARGAGEVRRAASRGRRGGGADGSGCHAARRRCRDRGAWRCRSC